MGMNEFAALIKSRREEKGIRAYDLAYALGMAPSWLSKLESGGISNPPAPHILSTLSKELGISQKRMLNVIGYEITEQELGTTVGLVEVAPDDPREAFIERVRRLKWTEGVNRSLNFAIGIVEAEQGE